MQFFYDNLIQPFIEFGFMRRALVACLALSISAGPIGVFLVLRRMSLMGDAMSHAILPGAALGFLAAGVSLWAMSLGGLIVALIVALAAGAMSRVTPLKEDAALAGFFLISLALPGVRRTVTETGQLYTHPATGSWVRVIPAADGTATLSAQGPRPLREERLDLLAQWEDHGRPEVARYGLTVTPAGDHLLWLDTPQRLVTTLVGG